MAIYDLNKMDKDMVSLLESFIEQLKDEEIRTVRYEVKRSHGIPGNLTYFEVMFSRESEGE